MIKEKTIKVFDRDILKVEIPIKISPYDPMHKESIGVIKRVTDEELFYISSESREREGVYSVLACDYNNFYKISLGSWN